MLSSAALPPPRPCLFMHSPVVVNKNANSHASFSNTYINPIILVRLSPLRTFIYLMAPKKRAVSHAKSVSLALTCVPRPIPHLMQRILLYQSTCPFYLFCCLLIIVNSTQTCQDARYTFIHGTWTWTTALNITELSLLFPALITNAILVPYCSRSIDHPYLIIHPVPWNVQYSQCRLVT